MIKKIAKLANLIVEDEKLGKEFSSILEYVNKLKEVDVSGVEETANLSPNFNVFRKDIEERKKVKEIIDLIPEKENNYLRINEIFEEND